MVWKSVQDLGVGIRKVVSGCQREERDESEKLLSTAEEGCAFIRESVQLPCLSEGQETPPVNLLTCVSDISCQV